MPLTPAPCQAFPVPPFNVVHLTTRLWTAAVQVLRILFPAVAYVHVISDQQTFSLICQSREQGGDIDSVCVLVCAECVCLCCPAQPATSTCMWHMSVCLWVGTCWEYMLSLTTGRTCGLRAAVASLLSSCHNQTPHSSPLSCFSESYQRPFSLGICIWPIATVLWRAAPHWLVVTGFTSAWWGSCSPGPADRVPPSSGVDLLWVPASSKLVGMGWWLLEWDWE